MTNIPHQSGIVLFAKRPGVTSFSSLFSIKRALGTKKVGHTGTLDSFASGLLVVCTGSLTRIASYITSFNKIYDAVIEFGVETDTLEYTGKIAKTAPLPKKDDVLSAIKHYTGDILQTPPLFSALHINGERASDIARSGRSAEMPLRPVTVYASEAEEFLLEDGRVKAVRVRFSVSKGTYIRSLARDIGSYCKSAAHLAGLRRLSVGSFRLEDAAGFSSLAPFTVQSVYQTISDMQKAQSVSCKADASEHTPHSGEDEKDIQSEVCKKMQTMTESLAAECGFGTAHIFPEYEDDFKHGRPLSSSMFEKGAGGLCAADGATAMHGTCTASGEKSGGVCSPSDVFSANDVSSESGTCASGGERSIAVFGKHGNFLGMILRRGAGAYSYEFVVPD
ncbi:tRNA pseudouridine(55) synthase TruB [Treponema socranskii]|uniref:tRNA pseudouridine(55) synthase TruB n=1 Tax=Treponema socranskii TaxID=53419 RepID=UPI003D6EE45F